MDRSPLGWDACRTLLGRCDWAGQEWHGDAAAASYEAKASPSVELVTG